nr:MAG TPA: PROTEIN/RNA Complex, archaeal, ribosomal, 50S, protein.0A [Caudoviricetes sp.]
MKCQKCGTIYEGNFCSKCGNPTPREYKQGQQNIYSQPIYPPFNPNENKKKRNPLFIVLLIILIIVASLLIIGIVGAAITSTDNSPSISSVTTPQSTEFNKETAQSLDLAINGMTVAAEKQYNELIDSMSQLESGEITLLDVYNKSISVQDTITKLRTQIEDKSNSKCTEYVEASSLYLSNMWAFANYIEKYISDQNMDDLNNAQETLQAIVGLKASYIIERTNFLDSAGFTKEEIEEIFSNE